MTANAENIAKNIVVDAYALLLFLQDEDGAELVEKHLAQARAGNGTLYMSEINLGEVHYIIARRIGLNLARIKLTEIKQLPIKIVTASWTTVEKAAAKKPAYASTAVPFTSASPRVDRAW